MKLAINGLLITSTACLLLGCAVPTGRSPEIAGTIPWPTSPPAAPAEPPPDGPLPLSPRPYVDENLFLLRALEATYQGWPSDAEASDALQNWLARTRVQVERVRATIRDRSLDADVSRLYEDCLNLVDAYEAYLARVNAIDRSVARQAQSDYASVFLLSFARSALYGPVAGVLSGLGEGQRRNAIRDEARRAAADAEIRRVRAAWVATSSRAEVVADRLTRQRGWRAGEAGFDGDSNRRPIENAERRPRDPFIKARIALTREKDETPDRLMIHARSLVDAARLVPEGRAYDGFRIEFMRAAADLAVNAALSQLPDATSYTRGPAPFAQEAIRISNTLLAADTTDTFGWGNALLARALAAATRYEEGLQAARVAAGRANWRNDAAFSVRTAKMASLSGQLDDVGRWLRLAYQNGFSDVNHIRASPDFESYRKGKSDEYKLLTTPRFTWRIVNGVVLDDVVLQNDSPFALTNVTLDVLVRSTNREWKQQLKTASVAPGQSFTFKNVFSIPPKDRKTELATMSADQFPR